MGELSDEKREKLMRTQQGSVCFGTDPIVKESESMATFKLHQLDTIDFEAARRTQLLQRKRNWEFGHDRMPMQSSMRGDFGYKPSSNKEKAAAEALKKDLTSAHYTLGYDDPNTAKIRQKSVYQNDMGPSSIYASGPLAAPKGVKPPCSVMLGSESAPCLSTAQQTFLKHDLRKLEALVDGKSRSAALRKSNVLFGNDSTHWKTASSAAYTTLDGKPSEPIINARTVNVTFGNDYNKYESSLQRDFSQVEDLRQACIDKHAEQITNYDPKKVSFNFGNDFIPLETCSQAAFTEKQSKGADKQELQRISRAMKQVYLTLGDDQPKYESTIRSQFGPPPAAQLLEAAQGEERERRKRMNTTPSFEFGTDGAGERAARHQSLQHADMRCGLDGVDYSKLSGLSDEVRADLRKAHFDFGNDRGGHLSTVQSTYVPKEGKPSTMDAAVKADLRKAHFEFSYEELPPPSTTTRDQMVYHGRVSAALDPALKADLRAVHYQLGRDPPVIRSTYGNAFNLPRLS